MPGPEFIEVELPFIKQLEQEGLGLHRGAPWTPRPSPIAKPLPRSSWSLCCVTGYWRSTPRNGQPWLDERRLDQAVSAITRLPANKVMEANKLATGLLHAGISVEGLPDWDGGRGQTIHFIDWANPRTTPLP